MSTKQKKRAKKDDAKQPINLNNIETVKEMLSGVSLSTPVFGIEKKVDKAENDIAAEALAAKPDRIKTRRLLIDPEMEEYKDCTRIRTACRSWFASLTLPYPIDGVRLFRRDMRDQIWMDATSWAAQIEAAAMRLNEKRPQIIAAAKAELGKAFSEQMYPKDFRTTNSFDLREHSIEPPSYLAACNSESYKRELARQLSDIETGMQQFERQCMEQIGGNISRLVSAMNTGSNLHGSNLDQMRKAFARIATLKFEGTATFKAIMGEAREAVEGVGAVELRRPGGVRDETKAKLEALMARHKQLLAAKKEEVTQA